MFPGIWRRRDASGFGYNGSNHVEMIQTVPPAVEPVSPTMLKAQARIPYPDDDELLALYIQAARETVERYLRRALITQTWDVICDWGPAWIELPWPALQTINTVYTTSLDNVESIVPTSVYIVNAETNLLSLNIGNVWPLHRGKAGFRVNYTCGYGSTPTSVPATIRRAILALATSMDNIRDEPVMAIDVEAELRPYRIYGEPFRMSKGMSREDLLA